MLERAIIIANRRHPKRWLTFALTITIHALAVAGAMVAGVWDLRLPSDPPSQVRQYSAVAEVPRVPPAAGSRRASASRAAATPRTAPATPRLAVPEEVPDTIPSADSTASTGSPAGNGIEGAGPSGDETGVIGGEGTDPIGGGVPLPSPPMRAGGQVRPPQILTQVKPDYPSLAIRGRTEGYVILEAVIDRHGVVQSARVLKSSNAIFDEPAVEALYKWRFKPGVFNGNAVDTIFTLTVNFRLE